MKQKNKEYIFYSNEMHCDACVFLTENELQAYPGVSRVKSDLKTKTITVSGDFGEMQSETLLLEFRELLLPHGYTISLSKSVQENKFSDFKIALPVAFAFLVLFFLLQKAGLIRLINAGTTSYPMAFLVGVVASLSSCMAVVGGLVLSLSATFAKGGEKIKPQLLFHFGRVLSFFILGGVIGALGSAFTLNTVASFILSFLIGIIMLLLGLNLLDVFLWTKKIQPTIPQFIAKQAFGISKLNYALVPFLSGVATFFLPCGFTQSMQIYTLTTGNFLTGGLTMLAFALGTLPVLTIISFTSLRMKPETARIFFRTAGIVVIAFALINLINSFVVVGIVPPLFNL